MNCFNCQSPDNEIVSTAKAPENDRRRHQCLHCTARWTTIATFEAGSGKLPTNNPQTPPLMAFCPQTPTGVGRVFRSDSDQDQTQILSEDLATTARAQSKKGPDYGQVLQVFTDRWARSYRRPYPATPADRSQLGRFMREHGNYLATFADICDRYLSDRRQFVIDRSSSHTLKWLVTSGLAMYGGTPRETAEQFAARFRKEHETRKQRSRRPPQSAEMRALVLNLADGKAVRDG